MTYEEVECNIGAIVGLNEKGARAVLGVNNKWNNKLPFGKISDYYHIDEHDDSRISVVVSSLPETIAFFKDEGSGRAWNEWELYPEYIFLLINDKAEIENLIKKLEL